MIGLALVIALIIAGDLRRRRRAASAQRAVSRIHADAAGVARRRKREFHPRHRSGRTRHAVAPDLRHAAVAADRADFGGDFASLGVVLGLVAGYFRGLTETIIMRLMDVMLALPSLLLAIAVVAILGPGLINAMYAIAIVLLPHYVRLTRAAVIAEAGKEYVASSRIAGAGAMRLMFSTILPNCVAPLIVQATLGFSSAILDAAALGFLGLGAQPPTPEWGSMLAGALEFIQRASWVVTFPGLAILVTVLAFNLMGDGLRDALDPKLKR